MPFATSDQLQFASVAEVTFGTTPASPAFAMRRIESESMNIAQDFLDSNEINPNRMTTDMIPVAVNPAGSVDTSLSFEGHEDWIEGLFASTWGTATSEVGVSITAASVANTLTGTGSEFADVVVGQVIQITGFSNAANNGYHKITAKASDDEVTSDKTLVNETTSVNIYGQMMRNGALQKGFTMQKYLSDATTPFYINFEGAMLDTMESRFETGATVAATYGMRALRGVVTDTQYSGATVAPLDFTNSILSAKSGTTNIRLNNQAIVAPAQSISFRINNAIREQDGLTGPGNLEYIGLALGTLEVTGTLNTYCENKTVYDHYLNNDELSFSFVLETPGLEGYAFTFHRMKLGATNLAAGGKNSDMVVESEFSSIADSTTTSQVQIDKFAKP